MVGQGGHPRRSRLAALGVALLLCISLPGAGALGATAFAASGKAGAAAPAAPSATTQSAPPEGSNGNAFSELSKGGGEEKEATTASTSGGTTNESSNHNSKKTVIVIVVAALALLVAVGYVIVRDARKNAPATDPQVAEARSAHDTAAMLRKRRAKAKAARQARKHNR